MHNTGYFISTIRNQEWFRCQKCKYDTFERSRIVRHVSKCCPPRPLPEADLPHSEWLKLHCDTLRGLKIGISFLTWNTRSASEPAATAIMDECHRLSGFGVKTAVFWADNGSDDGTVESLNSIFGTNLAAKFAYCVNRGQSVARNDMLLAFLKTDCDYLIMVDGDIEMVPYSSFALARCMEDSQPSIGCVGMYSGNCTHKLDLDTASTCRMIAPWMLEEDPTIAWTNYGIFRRSVVEQCKFDETGPFDGPGWGFEDDEYYLQMLASGFTSHNTKYFRHLHRRRHSSLKNLDPQQAIDIFTSRRDYVISKWKNYPHDQIQSRTKAIANWKLPVLEY